MCKFSHPPGAEVAVVGDLGPRGSNFPDMFEPDTLLGLRLQERLRP